MSDELELETLHSDDRLLDCLAGRITVSSPDLVSDLLAAFAAEVDTYPVLLSDAPLLTLPSVVATSSVSAFSGSSAATASATASVGESSRGSGGVATATVTETGSGDIDSASPAPPISLPARRRRRQLLPRTAAAASAVVVVLGVGGAAAAVSGSVGPVEHLKRMVTSVTAQVVPSHSREEKAAELLDRANAALRAGQIRSASETAGKARLQLVGLAGAVADNLRAELISLQNRIDTVAQNIGVANGIAGVPVGASFAERRSVGDSATGATASGSPSSVSTATGPAATDPASPSAGPSHRGLSDQLADTGVTDATDKLPKNVPGEPGLGEAKERLKDKAKEELGQVPEQIPGQVGPVGPVAPWRNPTSAEILNNPLYAHLLHGAGGEALSHSDAKQVAEQLAGGAVTPKA